MTKKKSKKGNSSGKVSPKVPEEKNQPITSPDEQTFGVLPDRDFKKNLGCG